MKSKLTAGQLTKLEKTLKSGGVPEDLISKVSAHMSKKTQPVRFRKEVIQRAEAVFGRDKIVIICGPTQRVYTQKGFAAQQKLAENMQSKRSVTVEQELPLESTHV